MTQPHSDSKPHLARRLLAEAVGAALFAAAVLGASLVGEQLVIVEPGSPGLALLAVLSGLGAAMALFAIMTVLGPVSGGYVNPIITFAAALRRVIDPWSAAAYMAAQYAGAALGVVLIHAAFGAPLIEFSARRIGGPAWAGEAAAAFALTFLVYGVAGARAARLPLVTASVAAAVHFCTLSFSFGNPALTLARSFAGGAIGVSPADGLAILLVQLMASLAAAGLGAMVFGSTASMSDAMTQQPQPSAPARGRAQPTPSASPGRRSPIDPPVGDDSLKEQLAARLAAAKARVAREEAAERAYQQRKAAEAPASDPASVAPIPKPAHPAKAPTPAVEPEDAPPPRRRTAPPRAPKAPITPAAAPPPVAEDGTYAPAPQAVATRGPKPAAPSAAAAPTPDAAAIEAQLEERRRMREKLRAERQAKADALRTEIQSKRKS